MRTTSRFAVLGALLLTAGTPSLAASITLGQGPSRGTDRAGVTWYEEFQDWSVADVRELDDASPADPVFLFNDGLDASRDLIAFYTREESGNLYFRVDVLDLALGAESSALDIYLAVDATSGGQPWLPDFIDVTTDRPWELCLAVYRPGTNFGADYRMWDSAFGEIHSGYLGSYFHSQIDAVEFGITRQTLLDRGWNGTSPLTFQVFTTKDGTETNCTGGGNSSDVADALTDDDRGCSDGQLNGGVLSTASGGRVYFASIAHGNQSVNRAQDVGPHVYDSQASTGISGGTGFLRTLDTHEIFRVPLNIHPSGTLTAALSWARKPGGSSDPQDGPSFLTRVGTFVDADQTARPGSLVGGVFAEHIMPFFEGAVNAASIALTDSLNQAAYGVSAADARVMHVPERVIRSQSTGFSPLDGHTFEDIAVSPYVATYLDEVTHLHQWFYAGETCTPDAGYRHKVHRVNGVYCFMINEREDGKKFANDDGGMFQDLRRSLLTKALYGSSSEIVVVFDDWEALAGKSFDPIGGVSIPNNNPNQYHNTIRWAANHPWIRIMNLEDLLDLALASPGAFVIDHGYRYDLPLLTYEWLQHACENSYFNWYYNQNGGQTGNEQSFYDLVPVITGPQGDYGSRGATPAQDGPPLPSGLRHGDLNTPGSLLRESWAALENAPPGRLREAGVAGYLAMIYETAWHEENEVDYSDTDCYGNWVYPDGSWDGVNTWALRLQNHVRQAGFYAAAADWAEDVRTGMAGRATVTETLDLDQDGEVEYVIRNNRSWLAFEKYGGRCVLAAGFDPAARDAEIIVGAPLTNPSAPGEEEYAGSAANRCSAWKEMNGGAYADAAYTVTPVSRGFTFTSPDGRVVKTFTVADGSHDVVAAYTETVTGPLYVRLGLSPNPLDLAFHGQAHLVGALDTGAGRYTLMNTAGGGAVLDLGTATFNPAPADAGTDRRNLALTEQVELSGDGSFTVTLTLVPGVGSVTGVESFVGLPLRALGPYPMPSSGRAFLSVELDRETPVRCEVLDVSGRLVASEDLGRHGPGTSRVALPVATLDGSALPAGLYFVRVSAGSATAVRKWVRIG